MLLCAFHLRASLNHCMFLSIYKKITNKLNLIDFASEFRFGSNESSRLFDRFCQNDLHFKGCTF